MNEVNPIILILLVCLLIAQSTFLFTDARKRGHAKWFWGIWGMIQTPMPLLFYLLWSRSIKSYLKKRREEKWKN